MLALLLMLCELLGLGLDLAFGSVTSESRVHATLYVTFCYWHLIFSSVWSWSVGISWLNKNMPLYNPQFTVVLPHLLSGVTVLSKIDLSTASVVPRALRINPPQQCLTVVLRCLDLLTGCFLGIDSGVSLDLNLDLWKHRPLYLIE